MELLQDTLSRLSQEGAVELVSHGLYLHPDSSIPPEEIDLAIAQKKFGKDATIGGITALYHYGLIDQVPTQIWVMVPAEKQTHDPLYRLLRIKTPLDIGITQHKSFNITNLERTLVEAFRYASKIGLRTAIRATQRAIEEGRTSLERIAQMAKALHLPQFLNPYWEVLIATTEEAA